MQYYRVWIYTCNFLLLLSVLTFFTFTVYVGSDYRLSLISRSEKYQPVFALSYLVLFVETISLQVVGYLAVIRLSERLLQAYWAMLLVLFLADVVLAIVWHIRSNDILAKFTSMLKHKVCKEIPDNEEFASIWTRVQIQERCCGVDGPDDFLESAWSKRVASGDFVLAYDLLPLSCCYNKSVESESGVSLQEMIIRDFDDSNYSAKTGKTVCVNSRSSKNIQFVPCGGILMKWLQRTVDLMLVLRYCVIAFVKFCFVSLLWCELQEMIVKIRMLKGSDPAALMGLAFLARSNPKIDINYSGTRETRTHLHSRPKQLRRANRASFKRVRRFCNSLKTRLREDGNSNDKVREMDDAKKIYDPLKI